MNRREECELKDRYTDKKEKWGLTQEREKGSVKTDKGLKKTKTETKKLDKNIKIPIKIHNALHKAYKQQLITQCNNFKSCVSLKFLLFLYDVYHAE